MNHCCAVISVAANVTQWSPPRVGTNGRTDRKVQNHIPPGDNRQFYVSTNCKTLILFKVLGEGDRFQVGRAPPCPTDTGFISVGRELPTGNRSPPPRCETFDKKSVFNFLTHDMLFRKYAEKFSLFPTWKISLYPYLEKITPAGTTSLKSIILPLCTVKYIALILQPKTYFSTQNGQFNLPGSTLVVACGLPEENHYCLYWYPCSDKGPSMNKCV